MRLLICGFTGSGKTTLLRAVEQCAPGIAFDLDSEHGSSPPSIIERSGFDAFRESECAHLHRLLQIQEDPMLVALGGGTLTAQSYPLVERSGAELLWLDVPFEVCWERIRNDSMRPIVKLSESELRQIYTERCLWYKKARYVLSTRDLSSIHVDYVLKILGLL